MIAAVISQTAALSDSLERSLESTPFASLWRINDYPDKLAIAGLASQNAKCVVFLDCSNASAALTVARELSQHTNLSTIAVDPPSSPEHLIALMQCGVREVLKTPFDKTRFSAAVSNALRLSAPDVAEQTDAGHLYAFVPAKPGAGATTLATAVSASLAIAHGSSAVLLDFDLRLGMTSFLLKLESAHSVIDALEHAESIDDNLWPLLTASYGELHVLGSAPCDVWRTFPVDSFVSLVNFARSRYSNVIVDLPGSMEDHEIGVLQRAKEIFVVATSDVSGLHMARRKSEQLHSLGVHPRVSILLNRTGRRMPLSIAEMERMLDLQLRLTFPTDEDAVTASVQNGKPIRSNSSLGKQIDALARYIANVPAPTLPQRAGRRFVEYFSVSQVRQQLTLRGGS